MLSYLGKGRPEKVKQRVTSNVQNIWIDNPQRYGLISRALHWGMAYLLLWQFMIILIWRIFGSHSLVKAITELGPYHGTVGGCVVVLVVIRAIWALFNKTHRPAKAAGWSGLMAAIVHRAFYGLMFIIPALAVARAYGNGKGWLQWGCQIIPATGQEIPWLVAPADLLHGPLSWALLVLMLGHIVMALLSSRVSGGEVLTRMAGRLH